MNHETAQSRLKENWPLNFESHGKVRSTDVGYGKPAITQSDGVDYYIRGFGNVQLHGAGGRQATSF